MARTHSAQKKDAQLDGLRVAILVSDLFEQVELTEPRLAAVAGAPDDVAVMPLAD